MQGSICYVIVRCSCRSSLSPCLSSHLHLISYSSPSFPPSPTPSFLPNLPPPTHPPRNPKKATIILFYASTCMHPAQRPWRLVVSRAITEVTRTAVLLFVLTSVRMIRSSCLTLGRFDFLVCVLGVLFLIYVKGFGS